MTKKRKNNSKTNKKTQSHKLRNIIIVSSILVVSFVGVMLVFYFNDNPLLSDEEWYDGEFAWTTQTDPDDDTLTYSMPKEDIYYQDYDAYDEFEESEIPGIDGFIVFSLGLEDPDDLDSDTDFLRYFICLYAELDDTDYDGDDLRNLIDITLGLDYPWEEHSYSGEEWNIDDHGKQAVTVKKAFDPDVEHMIGMFAYSDYYCIDTGRTYLLFYAVVKDTNMNEWDDRNFKRETKIVFESFTCHD